MESEQPVIFGALEQAIHQEQEHREPQEKKNATGMTFWLSRDSRAFIRPEFHSSYVSASVNILRSKVLDLLQGSQACLIGGTVSKYLRIACCLEKISFVHDAEVVPHEAVLPPDCDLDVAFNNRGHLQQFKKKLEQYFSLTTRYCPAYQGQAVVVESFWLKPKLEGSIGFRRDMTLKLDLVRNFDAEDEPLSCAHLGMVWPDLDQNQLAVHFEANGSQSLTLNTLFDAKFYFSHWMKCGTKVESVMQRFVRELIHRIETNEPARWCLLRPRHVFQLSSNGHMDHTELYGKYLDAMLFRLCKFLRSGRTVEGVAATYAKSTDHFLLPCSHSVNSLQRICCYSEETDALVVQCHENCESLLFSSFLNVRTL